MPESERSDPPMAAVGSAAVQPGGSQERLEADLGAARLPVAELTNGAEVSRCVCGGIFKSLVRNICGNQAAVPRGQRSTVCIAALSATRFLWVFGERVSYSQINL